MPKIIIKIGIFSKNSKNPDIGPCTFIPQPPLVIALL